MNNFTFWTPTKIFFGKGQEDNIGTILKSYNVSKVLIHYGQNSVIKSGLLDKVKHRLEVEQIKYVCLGGVIPNPSLSLAREGIELCRKEKVDFILAVGGGSVIDSAKAIANGAANPNEDVWNFSIGKASPKASLGKGAILTISAAGSEMSDSCVISDYDKNEKRGYCSPFNRLDFAIENPELTYSVSSYQTACGIVDISMHTIERYFCVGSGTDITDGIALSIIKNTFEIGKKCLQNPNNYEYRANLMWASSVAHNGLTGVGRNFVMVVHQLEHELSGLYPHIAHGAGLAALWCSWARYVYKANLKRWHQYAREIWGEEDILKAISNQESFYKNIGMPISLKELDVQKYDLEKMALMCSRNKTRTLDGDMQLSYSDILKIYQAAY